MQRHFDIPPSRFLQTSGLSGTGLNNNDFKKFKEKNLPQIMQLSEKDENIL
jgi:hypothetical protein